MDMIGVVGRPEPPRSAAPVERMDEPTLLSLSWVDPSLLTLPVKDALVE